MELYICIQIQINQLLIFTEKFSPLPGFEPGTDMLPIELSWLGFNIYKYIFYKIDVTVDVKH